MAQAPLHTLLHTLSQKSHVFVYAGELTVRGLNPTFVTCCNSHPSIGVKVLVPWVTTVDRFYHIRHYLMAV